MKIYLFNDTRNTCHSGCDAIMDVIDKHLKFIYKEKVNSFSYDVNSFTKANIILVNGEGTIHHNQDSANFLINILNKAQETNKKTYLINTVFQDMKNCEKVIAKLDYFSVREPRSLKEAKKYHNKVEMFPDLCIDFDYSKGIKLGDYEIVRGWANEDIKGDYPYLGLDNKFGDLIVTLKSAKLYITGQHHGIYASILADIPFIPIKSNSHKIEGLIEWGGFPIKLLNGNLEEKIDWTLSNIKIFKEFNKFIRNRKRFDWRVIND